MMKEVIDSLASRVQAIVYGAVISATIGYNRRQGSAETRGRGSRMEPVLFDTTLREGMQTPGGIGGSVEERIYAANLIARYADWVELGMPANKVDYDIIAAIRNSFAENRRDVGIAVLCRNNTGDVDKAVEVFGDYPKTLCHLFIGTSEEHRANRFGGKWSIADYVNNIRDSVKYAAGKPFTRIMFSPEDSYRTFMESRRDFFRFVDAAIEGYCDGSRSSGRSEKLVLNFPDTVGYSTVLEFLVMCSSIRKRYGNSLELSVHCHNDTGAALQQAVAVYTMGLGNWLQTTFAALGERNGIAPAEGLIPIMDERGLLNMKRFANDEDRRMLVPVAHAIAFALGRTVPAGAETAGERTRTSTAGIHTSVAQHDAKTYHIYGSRYGAEPVIEFGPTSGTDQILPVLAGLGIMLDKKSLEAAQFTDRLKDLCNREKRFATVTDLQYAAVRHFGRMEDALVVDDYEMRVLGSGDTSVAIQGKYNGRQFQEKASRKGSIEAVVAALDKVINNGKEIRLVDYDPAVVPRVPRACLRWNNGEYPEVPKTLSIESSMRAYTRVRLHDENEDGKHGDGIYCGHACGEDSSRVPVESVIDAVKKMLLIRKWEEGRNAQK